MLFVAGTVACARSPLTKAGSDDQHARCVQGLMRPFRLGPESDLRLGETNVGGVHVAAPTFCSGQAFIRLTRLGGRRRVVKRVRCHVGDGTACVDVPYLTLFTPALERLRARGIRIHGVGGRACASPYGHDGEWETPSLSVASFRDANEAVRELAVEMDAWDIGNTVGVSVRGMRCGYVMVGGDAR